MGVKARFGLATFLCSVGLVGKVSEKTTRIPVLVRAYAHAAFLKVAKGHV